jgi:hypothetical protein
MHAQSQDMELKEDYLITVDPTESDIKAAHKRLTNTYQI